MAETRSKASKGPFEVTRNIPLLPFAAERYEEAIRQLRAMNSVLDARINRRGRLHIRYDASCAGIPDIERILDKAGIGRPDSYWWRLKSAWYRFLDGNARTNAQSRGGACCNRPPSPWTGDRGADQDH